MYLPDDVKSKVEKLLALAESSNPHEAALAMEKAQEILHRYNMSREDLKPGEQAPTIIHETVQLFEHPYGPLRWRYLLIGIIARNNFCEALASRNWSILVGRKQDIETVMWLYQHLEPRIYSMANRAVLTYRDQRREAGYIGAPWGRSSYASFRNNYLKGVAVGIDTKLQKMRESMAQNNLAIVLYNEEAIAQYVKDVFKPRQMSDDSVANAHAFARGVMDGENMSWAKPLEDKEVKTTAGLLG